MADQQGWDALRAKDQATAPAAPPSVEAKPAPPDPWTALREQDKRSFLEKAADTVIPAGLRIGGAIAGGVGGGMVASPTIAGIPAGVVAGGAAGSGLGEVAAEAYEVWRGLRKSVSPTQIAVQTALGAVPVVGKAGSVGKAVLSRGVQGAALGGVSSAATSLAEGEPISLGGVAAGTALGAVLGGAGGAAEARAAGRRLPVVPPTVTQLPEGAVGTGAAASRMRLPSISRALEEAAPTHGATPPKSRITSFAEMRTAEGLEPKTGATMPNGTGGPVTDAEAAANRAMVGPREVPNPDGTAPIEPRRSPLTTSKIERLAAASGEPIQPVKDLPEARKVEPRMVAHLPEAQREDVLKVIEEHGGFEDARRGVVPNERTAALASWGDAERTRLKAGTILNAEDSVRLDNALARTNDDISKITEKVTKGEASAVDTITLEKLRQDQVILMANRLGVHAEIGRALQARKMMTEVLETRDSRLLEEALRMLDPKDTRAFAKEWAALPDDIAKIDFLRKSQKLTKWQVFQGVRYANMLSGVKTHLRNVIGTSVNAAFRKASHVGAVGYDLGRAKLTGADRTIFLSELKPQAVAATVGLKRGLQSAQFVMKHGFNPTAIETFDIPRPELRGGAKNPFNLPGRALEAEDAMMYELVYQPELAGRLYAAARTQGMKEGRRGRALDTYIEKSLAEGQINPPAAVKAAAHQAALEVLYREEGPAIGKWIVKTKQNGGKLGKALDFLVPFTKVPLNLLTQSIENVPGGHFLSSRAAAKVAQGGRAEAEMAGRQIAGGIGLMTMWLAAEEGLLSGKGPENADERATLMQQGWRPNSVKVGDKWVDYSLAMQPIAAPLFAIANLHETLDREGRKLQQSDVETVIKSLGGAAGSVLDQSFLSGLADFTEAVSNPSRFAVNYAGRTAQSVVVPLAGLQRNIAQTVDPVVRDPRTVTEHIKANVPGLSQTVAPKLEPFGEPATRSRAAGTVPITVSKESTDPVVVALKKAGVTVGAPEKTLSKTRTQPAITLSTEERQAIGRATRAAAEQLVKNGAWLRLLETDPDRAKQTVDAAMQRAREQHYTQIRMARRRAAGR